MSTVGAPAPAPRHSPTTTGCPGVSWIAAEIVALDEREQLLRAVGYAVGSVVLGVTAVLGGLHLGRSLAR